MNSIPIIGPIIELIKVLIIALILATILFALFQLVFSAKVNYVRSYYTCFAISLFSWTIWINSYWGDSGFYDTMRIPLGNDKSIESSFSEGIARLKKSIYNQDFTSFIVDNQILFGKLKNDSSSNYLIFDINKDTLLHFDNYIGYCNNNQYKNPKVETTFLTPSENFYNYWGKLIWLF